MSLGTGQRKYSEEEEVIFENRAVAFIDILGWSTAVEDSVTSSELRRKVLNAVWYLEARSKQDAREETPDFPSFDEATQFSDNVVISIPYKGHTDLLRLAIQITSYQQTMLSLGFLLRGGIAVGSLYHVGSLVFGPALNEAYRLESKVAQYPRVIFSKSLDPLVEIAERTLPPHWSFVVKGTDQYYSTDFLAMFAASEWATNEIDRKIDRWLSLFRCNNQVYQKYAWLATSWKAAKANSAERREAQRKLSQTMDPST